MNGHTQPQIRIAIDRGGTFTDCVASIPGQEDLVIKVKSSYDYMATGTDSYYSCYQ
jgi:N-methylhydantoinase A/oxoprolinase/acetone carboxylase beta subunit